MRSILARIIVIAAIFPLVPALLSFAEQARLEYQVDGLAVSGGSLLTLGQGLLAPVGVFALAAVVEMLFRISEKLPPTGEPSAVVRRRWWEWQSAIAKVLVVVAFVAYLVSGWGLVQYFSAVNAGELGHPADDRFQTTFSMLFYWATSPIEIIAWAAVIEYLSRIASALTRREGIQQ